MPGSQRLIAAYRGRKRRPHGTFLLFLLTVCAIAAVLLCRQVVAWAGNYTGRTSAYDALIIASSRRNGVDPRLVKAVIWRESRFNRNIRGRAGEVGLMQIMQDRAVADWAKAHNRDLPSAGTLYSPELNIEIGSWYLARALRRWSKYAACTELALCEYNAGLKRANAWKPPDPAADVMPRIAISSTYSYVNTVMKKYKEYQKGWVIE